MRILSALTLVIGGLGNGLIAAGADDGARADHLNHTHRAAADPAAPVGDGTSNVPASYDEPSIGQLTGSLHQPHPQIINAPQASGAVHERTQSQLDHQPMQTNVHEYRDPPEHPTLWQRFTSRTRSMFSRATGATSRKPNSDSASQSRSSTPGEARAPELSSQSSVQRSGSPPKNSPLWARRSGGATK